MSVESKWRRFHEAEGKMQMILIGEEKRIIASNYPITSRHYALCWVLYIYYFILYLQNISSVEIIISCVLPSRFWDIK